MSWWARLRAALKRSQDPEPHVQLVEGGFDVVAPNDGRVVSRVRWGDVARVLTYKRDMLTTDCICVLFEFHGDRPPLQISEEWPGFADLFGPLSNAFPSLPPDWYLEVMSPAFVENRRVLYDATQHQ
jgi:hypothetical protein